MLTWGAMTFSWTLARTHQTAVNEDGRRLNRTKNRLASLVLTAGCSAAKNGRESPRYNGDLKKNIHTLRGLKHSHHPCFAKKGRLGPVQGMVSGENIDAFDDTHEVEQLAHAVALLVAVQEASGSARHKAGASTALASKRAPALDDTELTSKSDPSGADAWLKSRCTKSPSALRSASEALRSAEPRPEDGIY